jgi:hypothetical protein
VTLSTKELIVGALKLVLSSLILAALAGAGVGQEITPGEFERLHKEIRPRPGEAPWAEIRWLYDLHKARRQAAAEGKPLCVWRMAGDPTGVC